MKAEAKTRAAKRLRVYSRDIAQIALFVALMVVGARISIPFPLVSLTFQTVFCVLAGLLLGARKGTIAMAVYLFMGLVGLPVFAAGGGFAYVLKPSFGYILGFVVAALITGVVRGNHASCSFKRYLLAAMAGLAANYALGIAYFIAVFVLSGSSGLGMAIVMYNIIYLPKDIVLCVLAAMLAKRVAREKK